jgi:ribosome-associated toxin RatA of RatAB toxin-antitoxin module
MFKKFSILTLLLLGINSICANEAPYPLYPITLKIHDIIRSGKAYIQPNPEIEGSGRHFHAYILIDASAQDVYNVVKKFQDYPQFMPHIVNVDAVEVDEETNFRYFLQLPLGIEYQYETSYQSYSSPNEAWLIWKLEDWEENNIEDTWGQWVISPYQNTNFTLVQYQVYTDLGHIPFGLGWIIDFLTEYSLPEVLLNIKEYVEAHE